MGAQRARRARICRTTRALTMAPRARLLRSRDAARLAARPRPNVLPLLGRPRERPPAFCAAWSACARNGFVRGHARRADAAWTDAKIVVSGHLGLIGCRKLCVR